MKFVLPLADWVLSVDESGPTELPGPAHALLGRTIPARVPGAVHADLEQAGLIPDPYLDDHEHAVAWVSRTDWTYTARVSGIPSRERVELVFDGLDTVATVQIDGIEVGRSRNMHRSDRYDVTQLLAGAGEHEVAVRLTSAYTEAEAELARLGPRPGAYNEPYQYVRKMACSFGWDWGLTLVGAGIWRPVRVETWHGARISGVRPLVDVNAGTGRLTALVDLERAASTRAAELVVELVLDDELVGRGVLPPGTDRVEVAAEVPDVRIWQPAGYGSAYRYDLRVRLRSGDGDVLDVADRRIGFRRLELDRSDDAVGSQFVFRINQKPVLVKGVNWIPEDVLPGRMTRERYETRLRQARDAGVNLVRVWGGGIYENDDFYDLCDELGLMVWQDFPFACACYPEEQPLRDEVIAEARENVARLSSHPSLVLWNGNNENLWLYGADHWAEREGGDLSWGERYYLHDLPAVVAEVDPSRPYSAGSPWSGSWEFEPNDPDHQTFHSWDVWNREDYSNYRKTQPRFVSEFGWQAPPAFTTLREAISDDPMTPTSPGVRAHQKAEDGNGKLARGLAPHYPVPDDVDAWHFLIQLNQVRAVETGVSHWLSHWPHTAGTILWQLNDLWPVISWSAIDSAGRLKPLYHALRELYAPRTLSLQPTDNGLELCLHNDCDEPWAGRAMVRRLWADGRTATQADVTVQTLPRSVQRAALPAELLDFDDPTAQLLVAEFAGRRALWYACEPKDMAFTVSPPTVEARATPTGLDITLTAGTLLRDLLVQPDRIHPGATADRGFMTLLPGESATIAVACSTRLEPDAIRRPYAVTWLDQVLQAVRPDPSGGR